VDIASSVDRIIDYEYGVHDLGEVKQRYLGTGIVRIPLGPDITVYELKEILRIRFPSDQEYRLAVKAALLHHFLDKIERCLKERGAVVDPEKIIDRAMEKMLQHLLNRLSSEELMRVYLFLKSYSSEVVNDILEDMKNRGIGIEPIGPKPLMDLLKRYIDRHGYKKLILIPSHIFDGRPLPLVAAARKIFNELKKGNPVTIKFVTETRPYISGTRPFTFRSLEELIEFLTTQ